MPQPHCSWMHWQECHLQAIQALEQISELQPGDAEVAKMLARLHHRLGDSASATKVLQVGSPGC